MNEEIKPENMRIHSRADELIACLEGEIAKRDEELASCRVAVENCEAFRARIAELEARIVWLECEAQVNAAPVSEAKAQGVVMPERAVIREVFMRNGFTIKEGQSDLKPYVYAAAEELLQLAAPAQQVSVPDVWRELAKRADDFLYSLPETDGVLRLRADLCSMLAAPAAPAADAGLVEALDYQALFDAIAAATSVYANGAINISVQAFRDALAAHRAQELTKEPSHD